MAENEGDATAAAAATEPPTPAPAAEAEPPAEPAAAEPEAEPGSDAPDVPADAKAVDLSSWQTEMAEGLTDQADRPRRQMIQLAQTNAQLKKIVEYNHGLVGEVVSKLRDDLIRPFFTGWKQALAEELERGRRERKGIKLVGGVEMRQRGKDGTEQMLPVVVGRGRLRDLLWHWFSCSRLERNDKRLIRRNLQRQVQKIVALGFYTMLDRVDLKKRRANIVKKVFKRLVGVRVACAWKGWHAHYLHEKHNRVKTNCMLKKLAYNSSTRSLHGWKHFLHELKRHRHLVKQSLGRLKERKQHAAFSGWYQVWTRMKRNRVLLARASAKCAQRGMAIALHGLQSATRRLRVRKTTIAKGLAKACSTAVFMAAYKDVHQDAKPDGMPWKLYMQQQFERTPGSYHNHLQKLGMGLASWAEFVRHKKAVREKARVAAVKIANGKVSRALTMWNHQIEADHQQRAADETAARHDVDVQALMAEVDRLGIDNRRLIRQVEQLMGTQDVAATIEPKSPGGTTTPRGSRRGKPAQQEEDPGIGRIEHEVAKLHNVIAEMAEREERLLRMLQLPDVKPEPGPIKKGDFVRKNRALVHHTSSFNSLLRQLRKEALGKDDKALLVNVDKMAYANLYVTDGDLHVQAVDTLPTPNPRGVFDSQRTNMIGNARAVPYFGPPKPKPTRSTVGPGGRLPSLTGRPGSAPATAPAGTDGSAADSAGEAPSAEQERVEKMLGALYSMSPDELENLEKALA